MKNIAGFLLMVLVLGMQGAVFANEAPAVSNVSALQRDDNSKLVDIYYDLADADGDNCTVWIVISDDGGINWRVPADTYSGAVGNDISPGTGKHVIWDAGKDMPGKSGDFKVRVFADDGNGPGPMVLVPAGWFAYQNASVGNYTYVDSFMIGKYEVTSSEYIQFLNVVDSAGNYWYSSMSGEIIQKGDAGNYYYELVQGRESYPARWVNFYDANDYCQWKSNQTGLTYRLPTEHEWEKAAGWDPIEEKLYIYGFHQDTISCSWCNYNDCYSDNPLPVGSFNGTEGKENAKSFYGCYDMSGNLWEWITEGTETSHIVRGGNCGSSESGCRVVDRNNTTTPLNRSSGGGFRLVREIE